MFVRPAKLVDAPEIVRINIACWKTAYKDILPQNFLDGLDKGSAIERWENTIEKSNNQQACLWVAEYKDSLEGFVHFGAGRDDEFSGMMEIYAVYVSPDMQGKGIGRSLFEKVRTKAQERAYKGIYVRVLKGNDPAVRFYEGAGARRVERDFKYFELDGESYPELTYSWPLDIR